MKFSIKDFFNFCAVTSMPIEKDLQKYKLCCSQQLILGAQLEEQGEGFSSHILKTEKRDVVFEKNVLIMFIYGLNF